MASCCATPLPSFRGSAASLPVCLCLLREGAEILEIERYHDDPDFLGYVTQGTKVDNFILSGTDAEQAKLAELAGLMGFTGILDRGVKFLSTGEMRKALICKALLQAPELLVLDEPFDGLDLPSCAALPCQGLDDLNREMVLKLVDHLGRSGKTQILYVTHHPEDHIPCITNGMELVPADGGGCTSAVQVEAVAWETGGRFCAASPVGGRVK